MNFLWIIAAFLISQTMAGPVAYPEVGMDNAQTLETSEENQAMWNEEVKNWTEDDIKKGYREYLAEDNDAAEDDLLVDSSEQNEWAEEDLAEQNEWAKEDLAGQNEWDEEDLAEENEWAGGDKFLASYNSEDINPATEFDGWIGASTEHGMEPVTEFDGLIEASTEHGMEPVTEFDGLIEASTEHGMEPVTEFDGLVEASTE